MTLDKNGESYKVNIQNNNHEKNIETHNTENWIKRKSLAILLVATPKQSPAAVNNVIVK